MELLDVRTYIVDSFPGTHVIEADGDLFFVHDPDHDLPPRRLRPWATIVTSNSDNSAPVLDTPGVFRVSIGISKALFQELIPLGSSEDTSAPDVLMPHPWYGKQYWVCVLNPESSWPVTQQLLHSAHEAAERKYRNALQRRQG